MPQPFNPRRQFFKSAATAGASLAMLNTPLAHAAPNPSASPSGSSRLRVGLCAYSYREQLTTGAMSLDDLFQKAVELRVDAIDLTVYFLKSTDPAYLASLRHLARKNAIPLCGAACKSSILDGDDVQRQQTARDIHSWLDVTDHLGAAHLRIFAGKARAGETLQQAIDCVVETMKPAVEYAATKGIILALEDHPGISGDANVCLEIMHRLNSPYAGIALDLTHFIPTPAMDAYAQIAACLPYATLAHVRDRFDDKKTPVDLDRVGQLFANANFRGYMAVEYDAAWNFNQPATLGVPPLVAKTRELCKKYSAL